MQNEQQSSSEGSKASIPIMDMRTVPPHQRRDVDGNYGDAPQQVWICK